jgi:hypothetical protein
MKPLQLLACVAFLFIAGCKKNDTIGPVSLSGTWELYKASGDITINYPAGNGNILKLSGNSYQMYTNGTLTKSGTFTVEYDTTATTSVCLVFSPGQFTSRIIYDGDYDAPKFLPAWAITRLP